MTDDRGANHPAPPVHVNHYCEQPGCKKWGAWGYSAGKEAPKWFCMEHRPDQEAKH